jgi:hypothetical protein
MDDLKKMLLVMLVAIFLLMLMLNKNENIDECKEHKDCRNGFGKCINQKCVPKSS